MAARPRPPATLYHYTNADGLLSMFRSGHLWATDVAYMNDPKELRYGFDLLAEVVASERRLRRVYDRVMRLITVAIEDKLTNGRVYVASFCRHPDLLSQWRAYGANGGGFAIGLASRALLSGAPQIYGQSTRRLEPVLYDRRRQIQVLASWLRDVSSSRFDEKRVLFGLFGLFSTHLMSFKHPSYREEGEWRLIQFGRLLDEHGREALSLCPPSFRVRGAQIVTYGDLDLTGSRGKLARKLPAVSIVCGPTIHRERGMKVVRELCESLGFACVPDGQRHARNDLRPRLRLSFSEAPFVG
jgi:hypothetical protein